MIDSQSSGVAKVGPGRAQALPIAPSAPPTQQKGGGAYRAVSSEYTRPCVTNYSSMSAESCRLIVCLCMHQNWLATNYLAKSVSALRAHIRSICFVHIHAHSVPGQLFHPGYMYATESEAVGTPVRMRNFYKMYFSGGPNITP